MIRFVECAASVTLLVTGGPVVAASNISSASALALPDCPERVLTLGMLVAAEQPGVGDIRSVEAGEPLIVSTPLTVREQWLRLNAPVTFNGQRDDRPFTVEVGAITLQDTDILASVHRVSENSYHVIDAPLRYVGIDGRPGKAENVSIWLSTASDDTTLHGEVKLGGHTIGMDLPKAPISRALCTSPARQHIRREIIYTGVVRGTVTLQYRESIGGIARPAFSQDGTFDLSAGNDIAFKGVHIRVAGAGNAGIRYMITSGFPDQ